MRPLISHTPLRPHCAPAFGSCPIWAQTSWARAEALCAWCYGYPEQGASSGRDGKFRPLPIAFPGIFRCVGLPHYSAVVSAQRAAQDEIRRTAAPWS